MSLADRQSCMELVKAAQASGAGRVASCEVLAVSLRTLERWEKAPDQGDRRRGPDGACAHALSEEEKQAIVKVSNRAEYRDLSPWQIVARLADQEVYLGSPSSFYRVLKQNDQLSHRQQSKPAEHHRPKELTARNPNEVWSWDITYLNSPIRGSYYYLYLVEDIFSRMIVGWTVEEEQSAEHSARLIDRTCREHGIGRGQLTLHADNGTPVKGATLLATLERLGIAPSFSRPRVSDDNPYSESLFKTLKYRPSYPESAFSGIEPAREWVSRFVRWYNTEHLHSAIRFVTPSSRHQGLDKAILQQRRVVYEKAKRLNPLRWSGPPETGRRSPKSISIRKSRRSKAKRSYRSIAARSAAIPNHGRRTRLSMDRKSQAAFSVGTTRKTAHAVARHRTLASQAGIEVGGKTSCATIGHNPRLQAPSLVAIRPAIIQR